MRSQSSLSGRPGQCDRSLTSNYVCVWKGPIQINLPWLWALAAEMFFWQISHKECTAQPLDVSWLTRWKTSCNCWVFKPHLYLNLMATFQSAYWNCWCGSFCAPAVLTICHLYFWCVWVTVTSLQTINTHPHALFLAMTISSLITAEL